MSQTLYDAFEMVGYSLGAIARPVLPHWSPSPLFEGYEASKYGEIRERSTRYVIPDSWMNHPGLPMVELIDPDCILYAVSRAEVVLDAFIGSPPNRKSVMFKNRDVRDANIFNLAWVLRDNRLTPSKNF